MDFVVASTKIITQGSGEYLAKDVLVLFNTSMRDKFTLYRGARKIDEEHVREMQRMDPETDLYPLLPDLFAEDLNASMALEGAPERVVLFFDSHEAFWYVSDRRFSDEKYFIKDEWLRRLLCALDLRKGIVVVVAGRECSASIVSSLFLINALVVAMRDYSKSNYAAVFNLSHLLFEFKLCLVEYKVKTGRQGTARRKSFNQHSPG